MKYCYGSKYDMNNVISFVILPRQLMAIHINIK